jgi:DNA-binding transcriptional MocR family regulator
MLLEDDVYGFLLRDPLTPLANLAPEHAFYLTSTSKSLMPGLRIGYVHAPKAKVEAVSAAVRASTFSAPPLIARIASHWIADGTADRLVAEKREEMARRQELVRRLFAGFDYRSDPVASHFWLTLPEPWRADAFAAAAQRSGTRVTPASAFAVGRQAPNALRICIGMPATIAELERGLSRLTDLMATPPGMDLSVV